MHIDRGQAGPTLKRSRRPLLLERLRRLRVLRAGTQLLAARRSRRLISLTLIEELSKYHRTHITCDMKYSLPRLERSLSWRCPVPIH
jgi:hypothetical protein